MEFKRRTKKIKINGTVWTLRQIVPADFLNCTNWPFSFYKFEGETDEIDIEAERYRKNPKAIKPEDLKEREARQEELLFQIFFKAVVSPTVYRSGFGSFGKHLDFEDLKKNEPLHKELLAQIFALAYNIGPRDVAKYPIYLNRMNAEMIYFRASEMGVEPYSLLADTSKEFPELYNALRHDFNLIIAAAGKKKLRKLQEEAEEEAGKNGQRR